VAIIKKDAKELGISTEGKNLQNLAKEVFETRIKKEAKDLGISINNKNIRELAHEVREKRIYQAAEKVGVDTKGKTTHDIFKEIMLKHGDKVKELNLFPKDNMKFYFLDKPKN
jgi:cell division protein FtsL